MSSRNKNDVKKLFEFWCEVAPNRGIDRSTTAGASEPAGIIIESFPENFRDKQTLSDIPTFAFPYEFECESVQTYSFVLTTDDSKWRFGFCRHDPKTQNAMVIITFLPWHDTFLRLLPVLAELRRGESNEFCTFLTETYNRGIPDLGGSLTLLYNGGQSRFVFERPLQFQLPSIPGNHNLNLYYNFVEPKNMIAVFASMLAERRIIFTSRRLDRLSACIEAANAFLYPMVWQHIFIPVLPMKLKDYLSAPMPYLIGVPNAVLETMTPDELGDVVILNCDTKIFESPFDDVHSLPAEIVSQLKKQLSQTSEHIGDRVSKIFLGVLVQLIGGYRDAVEFRNTGKTFNRDKFIETRPSHLRPFLAKMMELQIFQQFIDERLEMLNSGLGVSDEFEMETVRYAEKMRKRGRNYAFFKNVKDKTNPAVKSAVKSVKESSRGVKTAYKDLKSKFRDITPPNSSHFHFNLSSSNSPKHPDRTDGGTSGMGYASTRKSGIMAGHHSAPSSPVFSKRIGNAIGYQYAPSEAILNVNHSHTSQATHKRVAPPLAMSSSSSHIQPNGHAYGAALVPNNRVNHLGASPAVSPASSLCSSEMNLSQELQNHPLFKTPIVDRSLKPSNSLEFNMRHTPMRNNPPARPPPPAALNQHAQSAAPPASFYSHPYGSHNRLETKPPVAPRLEGSKSQIQSTPIAPGTLSKQQSGTSLFSSTPNKQLHATDCSFDNPPAIQSPPIPPRRQCGISSNAVATTAAAVSAGIIRLERNCWQDYDHEHQKNGAANTLRCSTSSNNSSGSSTMSSSSSCSSASFVTAASTFSHLNNSPPVPAPRIKKESLRSLQPQHLNSAQTQNNSPDDTMNDLISLDDSTNASFDLEDFDPLNQNARPLPAFHNKKSTTLPACSTTSSLMTASTTSISNPLYPYYAPSHQHQHQHQHQQVHQQLQQQQQQLSMQSLQQHQLPNQYAPPLPTSKPPTMPPPDDDFELLRKYGLDQFTVITPNIASTTTPAATTTATTTGKCMSNWTTFD